MAVGRTHAWIQDKDTQVGPTRSWSSASAGRRRCARATSTTATRGWSTGWRVRAARPAGGRGRDPGRLRRARGRTPTASTPPGAPSRLPRHDDPPARGRPVRRDEARSPARPGPARTRAGARPGRDRGRPSTSQPGPRGGRPPAGGPDGGPSSWRTSGGRTYRQVAVELGIPEGTAKSRLRLALQAISQTAARGDERAMGMNDDTPTRDELDDLAVYALDAHDPGEATDIESYLLANVPAAERWERDLRDAAGGVRRRRDAGGRASPRPPRPGPRRGPRPARPAGRAVDAATRHAPRPSPSPRPSRSHRHRAAAGHSASCATCSPHDWSAPGRPARVRRLDGPRRRGRHLAANASPAGRRARRAGAGRAPRRPVDNEARTAAAGRSPSRPAAVGRHRRVRGRRPAPSTMALAVRRPPVAPTPGSPRRSSGGASRTPLGWVLMVRAFETWTHTDDIRRALGHADAPPPPPSLRTMRGPPAG